ncbi:MAG: response regulator transcription factor [Rudaea sp.]
MMDKPPIRVLIVDDHPIVRSGLAAIISDQPEFELVGEAATAAQAITLAIAQKPRVMLVDLSLPDMDGVDLIASLNRSDAGIYFLVLTTRTGGDDINRALQAGAHAYLFKDTSSDELVSAIKTVADGGRYVPPIVGRKAEELPNAMDLTLREREVLLWLARGCSNDTIGEALGITTETVKSHMKNILGKLGLKSRSEAVALCLRAGLVHLENL